MDKKIIIKKIKSPKVNNLNKTKVSPRYKNFINKDISKLKKKR